MISEPHKCGMSATNSHTETAARVPFFNLWAPVSNSNEEPRNHELTIKIPKYQRLKTNIANNFNDFNNDKMIFLSEAYFGAISQFLKKIDILKVTQYPQK